MSELSKRFSEHLRSTDLCEEKDRILVALSGGKDSVCLLFLLKEESAKRGFTLFACHVNHGIRGETADRDEAFCRNLCRDWGIPFSSCRADVPAFCRESGQGLEEGARTERYRLLREEARRLSCHKIATAHTADDQAETVLFRLARGAGMAGAAGILERDGDLIRPLLPFSTKEILAFLKEKNLPHTEDETNTDLTFARNRIRLEVLPALETAVPGGAAGLSRFARIAARLDAFCRKACDGLEEELSCVFSTGRAPLAPLCKMAQEEEDHPLLYEVLKRMASQENIVIDGNRFDALVSLLKNGQTGKIIEIEKGFSFCREKDALTFQRHEGRPDGIEFYHILSEGDNLLKEIRGKLTISPPKPGKVQNIHKNLLIIQAASDRIEGDLFARNLRPGDRIRMDGMSRSVKKLLCDSGIPQSRRKHIPLICDKVGIFWIPGIGLCDRARDREADFVFTMTWEGDGSKLRTRTVKEE